MNIVLMLIASFVVAFFLMTMNGYTINSAGIGYVIGGVMVLMGATAVFVLILAGLRRLTTKNNLKNVTRTTWITWVVISSMAILGTYTRMAPQYAERQTADAVLESMADVYEHALVTNEYEKIKVPTGTSEEIRLIVELVNKVNEHGRLIDEKLVAQTESIGTPQLFDINLLRDKNNLGSAQESYVLLKQANIDSREERLLMLSNAKEEIMNMPISESVKVDALRGFERTHGPMRDLIVQYFDTQVSFCDEAITYFDFMKKASYAIQGEQVLFDSGPELNRYNDFVRKMQQIAELETQATKEIENAMKNQIDRARSAY